MNRKDFLITCGFGCFGTFVGISVLESCTTSQILSKGIQESNILVPITDFENYSNGKKEYKKYVIITNDLLKFPIAVFRFSETEYTALLMECSHLGAELQVFGDKLQCAAHGSEFNNKGKIESGPANTDLRKFPVIIENNILKISLK